MCLPKQGAAQDTKFLITRPMIDICKRCLTSAIARRASRISLKRWQSSLEIHTALLRMGHSQNYDAIIKHAMPIITKQLPIQI
jgi:hypothetical protein